MLELGQEEELTKEPEEEGKEKRERMNRSVKLHEISFLKIRILKRN